MKRKLFTACSSIAALLFLLCVNNRQNPYENPENVNIDEQSLANMTGTLKIGAAYACTVTISLPALADSMVVRVSHAGTDSLLFRTKLSGAAQTIFFFSSNDTGRYEMQAVVVKNNGAHDSLPAPKQFIVLDFAPQVSPIAAALHVYWGDSITVKFHVVARNGNLYAYSTSLSLDPDSVLSHRVYFYYEPLSHVGDDTIARTLKGKILLDGLTKPLVCYAQAFDRDDAYSGVASCTVYVTDTIRPKITLLPPHKDARDSIIKLPDSILVRVFDAWGVDSVTLNGVRMALVIDSIFAKAKQVIAALSQGLNYDTIIAWDKARNTDTVIMTLAYGGPPTYPPKIKLIDKSVSEGKKFDTLFLDTCVSVTDPAILDSAAYKASLVWSITDSAGNQVPSYNGTTRKLVVPVKPDSEWVDTFSLNFKVIASNGIDVRVGTFMVREVPDPPLMNIKSVQSKPSGTPFDTLFLDTCAKDPDNASSTLLWSFKNGKIFKIDSLFSSRFDMLGKASSITPKLRVFNRHVVAAPIDTTKANWKSWTGADTLWFTVRDPGGLSQKKPIIFEKYAFKPIIIDTGFIPIFPTLGKRR
jgi:hypothetical protein